MIIDFKSAQLKKFDDLALKIQSNPDTYLDLESISDFYKSDWLNEFPNGTCWYCSGLDNGDGGEFDILIEYENRALKISISSTIKLELQIKSD